MLVVTANAGSFRDALRGFQSRVGPKVITAVLRGAMGDLAEETARGVAGTTGLHRRVDTHRYIASWNRIAQKADGRTIGPTSGTGEGGNVTQPGDSGFSIYGRGLQAKAAIQNGVPYGEFLENGTARMPAGFHFARARLHITATMKARIARAMALEWKR